MSHSAEKSESDLQSHPPNIQRYIRIVSPYRHSKFLPVACSVVLVVSVQSVLYAYILLSDEIKTGTSQVGAISKAQKAQNIFLEKNLKFSKKIFLSENVAQC